MALEIREIPEAVQRLCSRSDDKIAEAAQDIRARDPSVICTIARGSSDHAAAYLKYATEILAGTPVASIGPSVSSIYQRPLRLESAAVISVSQSGSSPDIVTATENCVRGGAITVALTNTIDSPLARACHHAIDIQAGLEQSVAATKTFVTSIAAGLLLLAHWQGDDGLLRALVNLPDQCAEAIGTDWSELVGRLSNEESLFVLGRGPSMAIADEAALKFKETSQIHAESYSSAEVMHGPVSIVRAGFPVLALAARDAAEGSVSEIAEKFAGEGADVFLTSDLGASADRLPFVSTGHPLTDPLLLIVSFYVFIEQLARRKGINPDRPPNLRKVTETV